ncbi:endonuclease/exonuclease/phosphatase family protein [Arcobacteraceae bacterium]|nr:endonuclease/exonuclease/phosphatase family protein [Arcobacteraceae bacterium]
MKYLLFVFIYTLQLYSLDFKVASYNVENFFDLYYDKTEYKEFIPHTKYWNKTSFNNKLNNISRTIKDLDADILALQEIESQKVIDAILKKNQNYKYFIFHKNKNTAIGLALLSKYKITSSIPIVVDKNDIYSRDILKVNLLIDNKPLIVYVNHWRSKRAKESKRIVYAMALKKELDKQQNNDYIILGDLNSNYNEYQTFKYDKKLNDTFNITGINQILNTTYNGNLIRKVDTITLREQVHFNTWLEISKNKRFSTKYKNNNNTPDNILLSKALFDNKNISYINNSFNVFKPNYLFKKKRIFRWNKYRNNGYSDHLPIYAYFSSKRQKYDFIKKKPFHLNINNTINHLYEVEQISDYELKNVTIIYKAKNIIIVKQTKNDKAIMLYKPSFELKIGFNYDFTVDKIDEYNGLKEIKNISNLSLNYQSNNFKDFYLDGSSIDLNNDKYLNNIIYNIKGIYKKRHLYFDNKKIRLYFKKGIKKPKEGATISISSGHLSIYKSSIQIVLYRELDFKTL